MGSTTVARGTCVRPSAYRQAPVVTPRPPNPQSCTERSPAPVEPHTPTEWPDLRMAPSRPQPPPAPNDQPGTGPVHPSHHRVPHPHRHPALPQLLGMPAPSTAHKANRLAVQERPYRSATLASHRGNPAAATASPRRCNPLDRHRSSTTAAASPGVAAGDVPGQRAAGPHQVTRSKTPSIAAPASSTTAARSSITHSTCSPSHTAPTKPATK